MQTLAEGNKLQAGRPVRKFFTVKWMRINGSLNYVTKEPYPFVPKKVTYLYLCVYFKSLVEI